MENKELCAFAILSLTDGSARKVRTAYSLDFYSDSDSLLNIFSELVYKFCGSYPNIRNSKRCKAASKKSKSFKKLFDLFGSFRTDPKEGHYSDLNLAPFSALTDEELCYVLRLAFSTDGCVSLSSHVQGKYSELERGVILTSSHPQLSEFFANSLKRLGIYSRRYQDDIVISRRKDIKRFAELIGFIYGVKISAKSTRWKGIEKNELLNTLLSSYRKPS